MATMDIKIQQDRVLKIFTKLQKLKIQQRRQIALAQYFKCYPHQNIIKFIDVEFEENKITIIMEKAIPLNSQIIRQFSKDQILKFLIHCSAALTYLVQHGIQHRDIKAQNWVMVKKNNQIFYKLIDFGRSKMIRLIDPLQQVLGVDKQFRADIIKLQEQSNDQQMMRKYWNLNLTYEKQGSINFPPAEYQQGLRDKVHIHPILGGKCDCWLFGIQLLRLIFDFEKSDSARKILSNYQNQLYNKLEKQVQKLENQGFQMANIFQNSLNKQILFPNNDNFVRDLLKCIQGLFIINMKNRISMKYFIVQVIRLFIDHKIIQQSLIDNIRQRSFKDYDKDIYYLSIIKRSSSSSQLIKDQVQKQIYFSVCEQEKSYIMEKYKFSQDIINNTKQLNKKLKQIQQKNKLQRS